MVQQLVSLPSVKALAGESREHLRTGVNRFARRYELTCSSVPATFRRRAQLFSMIFGIGLALLANMDGLRIFEVYRNDTAVRSAVIAHEERVRSLADSENGAPIPEEFDDAQDETARLSAAIEWERQRASAALQPLAALRELGVPLGWGRYPACPYGPAKEVFHGLFQ